MHPLPSRFSQGGAHGYIVSLESSLYVRFPDPGPNSVDHCDVAKLNFKCIQSTDIKTYRGRNALQLFDQSFG